MKKIIALTLALALSLSMFTACKKNDETPEVATVEVETIKAIATVGGVDIPFDRYEKYFSMQSYELEKEHGDKIWNVEQNGRTMKEIRQEETIDYLIRLELLSKYVKDRDFVVKTALIEEAYEKYMDSIANDTERKAFYSENGIDEIFLKSFLEDQLYLRVYNDKVLADIQSSDDIMAELFENQYIRYKTSHILVDKENKKLLEKIRKEMVTIEETEETEETDTESNDEEEGEVPVENHNLELFTANAREISIHSTSAVKGGDLGFVTIGNMPEAYEKVALSIELYTISEIIETEYGYHLLFVDDRMMLVDMVENGMSEEEINTYKNEIIEEYAAKETGNIYKKLEADSKIERYLELLDEELLNEEN